MGRGGLTAYLFVASLWACVEPIALAQYALTYLSLDFITPAHPVKCGRVNVFNMNEQCLYPVPNSRRPFRQEHKRASRPVPQRPAQIQIKP
jgi:hypothetical protein